MKKFTKRLLVIILTFVISFNTISGNYQVNKVDAVAAEATIVLVLVAIAASMGIVVTAESAAKMVPDFQKWLKDNGAEDSTWGKVLNGGLSGLAITTLMVRDVREYFLTHGIDAKSGSVAEKEVHISTSSLPWRTGDLVFGYYGYSDYWKYPFLQACYFEIPDGVEYLLYWGVRINYNYFYIVTRESVEIKVRSVLIEYPGKTLSDAITTIDNLTLSSFLEYNYISSFTQTTKDFYFTRTNTSYSYSEKYSIYNPQESDYFFYDTNLSESSVLENFQRTYGNNADISDVSINIPSIGTYDESNISNLTDGRTLSAADLQAIADAINNPYADYKNSDGAITQEDLQAAVTAAIAAALAAAGEKEEPDNPTDDPVITAGFQGVFDWFQKVFDLLKTFFATATTFVTTFPLKLWRDALETFPATLSNIQDAVGDVFKVGEQISEALITFPTAESLKDLITGVPADLADLKDAVTIFPKAFQDAMTGVITDVFPSALIDALEDALPSYIAAGVTALPLTLVDILIPQLDLSIPKALEGSLPKILTDALAGSIVLPDIKVDFPTLEIPNYMDILGQMLAAILAIPALLTLDVPAIKTAAQAATKDVALETGIEPIITLFDGIRFDDEIIYPVIAVDTPDILKTYYHEPQIILLDFEDYAQYCQWARNIFRVTLWLAFLYWAAKQLQVHYHIG